jgi:hypothetical protein
MSAFKALNWSPNEMLGESKIDAMTDNSEFLFANTPRALYTLPGVARVEGVRLCSGRALITARASDSAGVTVSFGNYFSNGCQPIITTGVNIEGTVQIHCVFHGIGMLIPDHTGFQIEVNVDTPTKATDKIARSFYVSWQALGY